MLTVKIADDRSTVISFQKVGKQLSELGLGYQSGDAVCVSFNVGDL